MDLTPLLKEVEPLRPTLSVSEVADRLMTRENQRLLCLPVVDGDRPVGLVSRYTLQDIFMRRYGRELWERRPVADVMNPQPLVIPVNTRLEKAAEAVTAELQYPITEDFILVDAQGRYLGLGIVLDLLKAMARHLTNNRRMLMRAQQIAGLGSWEWQAAGDTLSWSSQITAFFGFEAPLCRAPMSQVLATLEDDSRDAMRAFFEAGPTRLGQPQTVELQRTDGNGRRYFLELQGEHIRDAETGEYHAIGTLQDITERRGTEERLSHLARFDHLTGLANRHLFQDRLRHAISRADRLGDSVALLFLDIDRFKWINDALGHAAGDELLKQVARRLSGLLRSADTVARLGGDEFTIILESVGDVRQAVVVAQKIIASFAERFELGERPVSVSTSIGIALYPDDAADMDALLNGADTAMYRAKDQGRNRYFSYSAEFDREAQRRLELERGLQGALERDEFELYFQPQVHTASGALHGAEALLRWFPEGRSVSPAEFIPLLENLQLIVPVGRWVLAAACRAAARWRADGLQVERVAVNISVHQLRQPDFVTMVAETLQSSGLPADALVVEVTESALLDDRGSAEALLALTRMGVEVAIDDFGTGYSSLAYLKRFAVDTLKLDRTFVSGLTMNADDDAIASAVITLAHSLGLSVTAEGVETVVQREFLAARGCDHLQGFLLARPLPEAEFPSWAAAHSRPSSPRLSVV